MIILGVDPGTLRTGIGVIQSVSGGYRCLHAGVVRMRPDADLTERLGAIHDALLKIVSQWRPDVLALEDVFYGKDARAMVKIGEARACAMLAASSAKVRVAEYPPASVKLSVTGNGRAAKPQVQKMVQRLLGLERLPETDAADALAVALCHAHLNRSQGIRKIPG